MKSLPHRLNNPESRLKPNQTIKRVDIEENKEGHQELTKDHRRENHASERAVTKYYPECSANMLNKRYGE